MSDFSERLKGRIDGVFIRTNKTKKAVAFALLAQIVNGTPVDSGRARGNWQTSAVRPIDTETGMRPAQVAIDQGKIAIDGTNLEDDIIIQNNLPYIYRLEYDGWSGQAPSGWVREAIGRFKDLLNRGWRDSK